MKEWTGPDLVKWYTALLNAFGPRNWWPADSAFETIIGAILAQNVSWNGAYQAACALKEAGLMDAHALIQAGPDTIAPLIRSSRYYNQKAQRIIIFLTWFFETCHGDISTMASWDLGHIRRELLHLSGFDRRRSIRFSYTLWKNRFLSSMHTPGGSGSGRDGSMNMHLC
jgi:endonuclease-3 related protein